MSMRTPLIATLAALMVSACSVAPIFTQPQVGTGKPVAVSGYLKFGFENRNLFPSENWQAHRRRGECLPVGVRSVDATLLAQAEELDGRKVTVTGTTERLVRPDEINASFCKDVGLIAVKIEAR